MLQIKLKLVSSLISILLYITTVQGFTPPIRYNNQYSNQYSNHCRYLVQTLPLNGEKKPQRQPQPRPSNTGTRTGGRKRSGVKVDDDNLLGKLFGELLDALEGDGDNNSDDNDSDKAFGEINVNIGLAVPTILITAALLALLIPPQ
jgi:hypothetical protein